MTAYESSAAKSDRNAAARRTARISTGTGEGMPKDTAQQGLCSIFTVALFFPFWRGKRKAEVAALDV